MIQNPVIGIIGGTGSMGQMFKAFFEKNGYTVLIASRKTPLTIEECAKKSDVVLVTVPMDKTLEIIQQVAPLVKKEGLLMDLTSLKKVPLQAMLQHSNSNVLGVHPIFGPGLESFKNQVIVLCPGRGQEWQDWFVGLLKKEEVKVKICSPEEHDKMMAVIQGMLHFTNITMGYALKELGIDIRDSLHYSSPIYKLRLDMVGRILNQDPRLYADIEIMNSEVPAVLKTYLECSQKLYNIVQNKDIDKFVEYFNEASTHFGDFKEEAQEFSNYIINNLAKNNGMKK